jgi:PBSX family phage terminase large subunit
MTNAVYLGTQRAVDTLFINSDKESYRAVTPDLHAWQVDPWNDKSLVLLLTGSAGGGKSWLAAMKVHHYMRSYPGAMGLMIRKTRESMNNSTVLFYATRIVGKDESVRHISSMRRFEYSNGSILAYGGMKDEEQREQVRSIGQDGGVDIVWVEEANKLRKEDYQELPPRLRGKAGPYRQIILSTNPDGPMHWIYVDLIGKKIAKVYYSSALDNPANPPDYINSLNMLTGVQRERLVEGKWVQAEGAIYDNWSHENIDAVKAEYNPDLPVFWAVDDGYKNPRVVLLCQEYPDGKIAVFAEYYRAQQLFDATWNALVEMEYPLPRLAIHDPAAAEFAAFLKSKGIVVRAANNDVAEGIKATRDYIKDGQSVISLFVHPRCEHVIGEIPGYTWSDSPSLMGGDPKPVKENDHSCDALRYFIFTPRGIEIQFAPNPFYKG